MSIILLSFESDWFDLVKTGQKKSEYRKHFPVGEETTVIFYVSQPVKAICGIAKIGARENLSSWLFKYNDRSEEVKLRIRDFLLDCNYAMPIKEFQMTNLLPLKKIKEDIPDFVVPRMYYYLDNLPLLEYLKNNLACNGPKIINNFETINDEDIC